MKKNLALMLIVGVLLAISETGYAKEIVISTFNFKSPNLNVAERVMTKAYKRIGLTMRIRQLPGERAIFTANSGRVDGELIRRDGMFKTYPNLIMVPVPVIVIDFVVFARKEKNFQVNGWESLTPYSVGYRIGVKTVETNLPPGTRAEAVAKLESAFKKLDIGRNDVVVDTRLGGLMKLNQLGMKDIIVLEPPLIASPQFHYLHIKNKHLLEPLTTALQNMEKGGVKNRA